MREVPLISQQGMEKSSGPDAHIQFVTITHPEISEVIRLVIDGVDYVLNGETYYKSFFELTMVDDTDQPPQATFSFPNVNRRIITMLRYVSEPARIQFEIYTSNYFDLTADPRVALTTPEPMYVAAGLFLADIRADQVQVRGTLRGWDFRQELYPDRRATKELTPGVFLR